MYTIKEFSQKLQINVSTIRYYERMGLLFPDRRENGYRLFDENDVERMQRVIVLKHAAFSLEEITEVLSLMENPNSFEWTEDCRLLLASKEAEIKEQIVRFQEVLHLLKILQPVIIVEKDGNIQENCKEEVEMIYSKNRKEK